MSVSTDTVDWVQVAAGLGPVIKEHADEAERDRRLSPIVAKEMAHAGLFRLALPYTHNGFQAPPRTLIDVIEKISSFDGATGWTLMIGLEVMSLLGAGFPAEPVLEMFDEEPDLILCGALMGLGSAHRTEGGWIVNGRWPFVSGCTHAHWFWAGCSVGNGETRQVLIPRKNFTILDTWHVSGLRGTGSNDVEVTDAFVPDSHAANVLGERPLNDIPIYRIPTVTRLTFNKVGVATGIARTAIDLFIELAATKKPVGSNTLLRETSLAQTAVADAEAALRSGRAFVHEAVDDLWNDVLAERHAEQQRRALVWLASAHAVASAVKAVDIIHAASGSTVNFLSSPLERAYRNVHVVPQHAMVNQRWYQMAGRVILGLPPDPGVS